MVLSNDCIYGYISLPRIPFNIGWKYIALIINQVTKIFLMESIEHNKLIELFNLASNNYYYTIISLFSLLISIYLIRKLIKEKI